MTRITRASSILLLLSCFILASLTLAGTPRRLSYQGRLTDDSGVPLNGTYDITFSIYQFEFDVTPLWSETHNDVAVANGLFNVLLGSVNLFPDSLFIGSYRYMGISVNSDPEMTPRFRLTSAPWAERVATVDGADAGSVYGNFTLQGGHSGVALEVLGGTDVISGSGGYFGIHNSFYDADLRMDYDEIQALELGSPSTLYLQRIGGNVGIGGLTLATLHVTDTDVGLPNAALQQESMIIEDDNAIVGLYSDNGGVAGSGLTFGEITSSSLTNKWTIIRETQSGGNGLRFAYGADNNPFNNTTHLYVDNTGEVGIGTESPNHALDVRGTIGNNSTTYHSDRRWKKNVRTLDGALDDVARLRGVSFEWRREEYGDMNFPEGHRLGLIAQEVEKVIPDVVHTDRDGYKSVEYANLVAVLIEAVKELREENLAQNERIEALQAKIAEMRAEL